MTHIKTSLLATTLLIGGAAALPALPASAHHSFSATFQSDAKITVEGTVKNLSFKNPHVLVTFETSEPVNGATEWVIEGSAATLMRRRGWAADTLKPGEYIRVSGDSTHDGSPMVTMDHIDVLDAQSKAVIRTVIQSEGSGNTASYNGDDSGEGAENTQTERGQRGGRNIEEYAAVNAPLTLENGLPNLSLAWAGRPRGAGRQEPGGLDRSAAGDKRQAAFILAEDPQVFCDPPGVVRQAGMTPHPFEIIQESNRVIFKYEEYGGLRIVPLGKSRADLVNSGVKTHLGDSIAYYEGDKLIVETINLLENHSTPGGTTISDQATVVEVMQRADSAENGAAIEYNMSVTDPLYFNSPVAFTKLKTAVADYEMIENDCRPPLRERSEASPSTNFFAAAVKADAKADAEASALNAQCEAIADGVNIGARGWTAHLPENGAISASTFGDGPWYNSRGDLIAATTAELPASGAIATNLFLSAASKAVDVSAGQQLIYCFGTTPTSSQSRLASLKVAPAGAGAVARGGMGDGGQAASNMGGAVTPASLPAGEAAPNLSAQTQPSGSKTWLWALLGALALGAIGFMARRKKS